MRGTTAANRRGSRRPLKDQQLRVAIPSDGKRGPAQSAIDVHAMAVLLIQAVESSIAAGRQPECRNQRDLPLAGMAVSAKDEVDVVLVIQLIEDTGSMGEQ